MIGDCPDPVPGETGALSIWGWTHREELAWLAAQAKHMNSVVEVGVLHGRSTYALLEACEGLVYAIDPFSDGVDDSWPSFWSSCGSFPNLVPVRGFSPAVIDSHDLPDVDMVFIDGNHDRKSITDDIEGWLPKTRKLICGHDFSNADGGYPDVSKVVLEMFGERANVAPETSIWYVELG